MAEGPADWEVPPTNANAGYGEFRPLPEQNGDVNMVPAFDGVNIASTSGSSEVTANQHQLQLSEDEELFRWMDDILRTPSPSALTSESVQLPVASDSLQMEGVATDSSDTANVCQPAVSKHMETDLTLAGLTSTGSDIQQQLNAAVSNLLTETESDQSGGSTAPSQICEIAPPAGLSQPATQLPSAQTSTFSVVTLPNKNQLLLLPLSAAPSNQIYAVGPPVQAPQGVQPHGASSTYQRNSATLPSTSAFQYRNIAPDKPLPASVEDSKGKGNSSIGARRETFEALAKRVNAADRLPNYKVAGKAVKLIDQLQHRIKHLERENNSLRASAPIPPAKTAEGPGPLNVGPVDRKKSAPSDALAVCDLVFAQNGDVNMKPAECAGPNGQQPTED